MKALSFLFFALQFIASSAQLVKESFCDVECIVNFPQSMFNYGTCSTDTMTSCRGNDCNTFVNVCEMERSIIVELAGNDGAINTESGTVEIKSSYDKTAKYTIKNNIFQISKPLFVKEVTDINCRNTSAKRSQLYSCVVQGGVSIKINPKIASNVKISIDNVMYTSNNSAALSFNFITLIMLMIILAMY